MAFVLSPEQVSQAQQLMLERRFTSEAITIGFETTEEFVRSVLPPCFEPHDNKGTINVGTGRGAVCGEYGSGLVNINMKYKGQVGQYTLTSIYSDDMAVIVGREFYSEPKKRGEARLFRSATNVYGYVERHGQKIIEIDGNLSLEEQEPSIQEVYRYEVLGRFNHQAQIDGQPYVFIAKKRFVNDIVLHGTASLKLNSNRFDAVGDIPIVGLTGLTYTSGEMDTVGSATEYITDGLDYTPYILGRHYDNIGGHEVPLPLQIPFRLPK